MIFFSFQLPALSDMLFLYFTLNFQVKTVSKLITKFSIYNAISPTYFIKFEIHFFIYILYCFNSTNAQMAKVER